MREPFLFFDFDGDSGLEVDGEAILKDRNLRDQALDQRLVKLCDGGGLLMNEILQVLDQTHLFILDHTFDLGLFSHIPEPEDFIRDGVVIVLLIRHLYELLLQLPEAFIDYFRRQGISLFDHCGNVDRVHILG